jgi:hypothetical protein
MLRRSLLISAVILTGSFGFASTAKAQTVDYPQDVTFTAKVNPDCELTAPSGGTSGLNGELIADGTGKGFNTSTPAMIGVDCSTGTLKIGAPVPDAGNATQTTVHAATLTTAGGKTVDNTQTSGISLDDTDSGDAEVSMTASGTDDLAADDYVYTVTITATL